MSYSNPSEYEKTNWLLATGKTWNVSSITFGFAQNAADMKRATSPDGSAFVSITSQDQIISAFRTSAELWNDLIDLDISEESIAANAAIRIGRYDNLTDNEGHGYYPPVGDIWVTNSVGAHNLALGTAGFDAMSHEFGHALGLFHAGNYDESSGTAPPSSFQDSKVYSIMSYFGPGRAAPPPGYDVQMANWKAGGVDYFPQTPMMNDILAIQTLYGAEQTTRTGDTVYGFSSNISGVQSQIHDFAQNLHPILCIYDAGGAADKIDLSGWSTNSALSLIGGTFSNANSMTMNISIAYDTVIEEAVTGSGNDVVLGNLADNTIYGNAGNDILFGGGGSDILVGGKGNDTLVGSFNGITADMVQGGYITGELGDMWNYHTTGSLPGETDTADYSASRTGNAGMTIGIIVDLWLHSGQVTNDGFGDTDTLVGINEIIGTSKSDQFTGGRTAVTFFGEGGADTFIAAGANGETYHGGDDVDIIDLSGLTNRGTRAVGSEQFHYVTALGSGTVDGSVLGGSATAFTIKSIEDVKGSNFTDRIDGNGEVNKLWGNAGNDILFGFDGDDFLYGGLNDDRLVGGKGADYLDGGEGTKNKAIYFWDATTGVEVNLITGTGKGGDAEGDTLVSIQEVDGTNYKDIIHLSNSPWGYTWTYSGDDEVYGGTTKNGVFDNLIYTREGSDRFYYQAGKVTYHGGTDTIGGIDTVDLSLTTDGYLFKAINTNMLITRNDLQNYQQISAYETEVFIGSGGADTFQTGIPSYTSGMTFDGGAGRDTLDLSQTYLATGSATGIRIDVANGVAQTSGGVRLANITNIEKFIGTAVNDTFVGTTTENWFEGGKGLDTLWAGAGIDHFDGGLHYFDNRVQDVVNYQNSNAAVFVDLRSTGPQSGGYAEGDTLMNVHSVIGSHKGDTIWNSQNVKPGSTIYGMGGEDTLHLVRFTTNANGGADDDILYSHGKGQTLIGGGGDDDFHFDYADTAYVLDYQDGEDIFVHGLNEHWMTVYQQPSYVTDGAITLSWTGGARYTFTGETIHILDNLFFV